MSRSDEKQHLFDTRMSRRKQVSLVDAEPAALDQGGPLSSSQLSGHRDRLSQQGPLESLGANDESAAKPRVSSHNMLLYRDGVRLIAAEENYNIVGAGSPAPCIRRRQVVLKQVAGAIFFLKLLLPWDAERCFYIAFGLIDSASDLFKKGARAVVETTPGWPYHLLPATRTVLLPSDHRSRHVIDGDLCDIDDSFFRLSPQTAAVTDPQQRTLLAMSYEVLTSAVWQHGSRAGTDTTVYAAILTTDLDRSLYKDPLDLPWTSSRAPGKQCWLITSSTSSTCAGPRRRSTRAARAVSRYINFEVGDSGSTRQGDVSPELQQLLEFMTKLGHPGGAMGRRSMRIRHRRVGGLSTPPLGRITRQRA
ncbi:hypothetical protein DL766_002612 [Monosporascus sp. MC13-8B]|uniref:Beta-ketoacyl synthase-like N-terminal domain-containing protein n=1 Tax=Monosporascus cannonballus TaxID=155416 RepID=A0ABY0H2X5_9PEZI|nr:hypothetical protein DL763_007878 [Monosporascus cannonballus]RYO83440.1 hypothetical protein DL762_006127 [Monosporascus cannonballus]RYP35269.1 hypothetical protein DL766_002612 [Monosporascus sp. MC13-8B]